MGNYAIRRNGVLSAWQLRAAELVFQGCSDDEICEQLFHPNGDKKKLSLGKQKLRALYKKENFQAYYRSIVTEWSVHNVGRALNRLSTQIDDPQPWLANKAANDILTQAKYLVANNDENMITVKVEGLPEIGSPSE